MRTTTQCGSHHRLEERMQYRTTAALHVCVAPQRNTISHMRDKLKLTTSKGEGMHIHRAVTVRRRQMIPTYLPSPLLLQGPPAPAVSPPYTAQQGPCAASRS